jgi:hypothetical protein
MELMMFSILLVACFAFGWIFGHAVGYEKGINEWPRR